MSTAVITVLLTLFILSVLFAVLVIVFDAIKDEESTPVSKSVAFKVDSAMKELDPPVKYGDYILFEEPITAEANGQPVAFIGGIMRGVCIDSSIPDVRYIIKVFNPGDDANSAVALVSPDKIHQVVDGPEEYSKFTLFNGLIAKRVDELV